MALYANMEQFFPWCSYVPKRKKTFLVEPVSRIKLVCSLKHLSCKQFHKIVKGDSTFLRNLRYLQNIHGLSRLSKEFALCVLSETTVYTGRFTSILKTNQQAYLLFDLLSVDNALK